jgi:hypothetical protein
MQRVLFGRLGIEWLLNVAQQDRPQNTRPLVLFAN